MLELGQAAKRGSYTVIGELKDSVTDKSKASMTITFTAEGS
jgi:hypothetical protein